MGPHSDFSKPCQGAAEKSANATRCCCLARGSQRVGMSTVEAVNRKISWLFCFVSHGCTVSARFLHGFKTCKGCKSLQNRTKGAETRSSKPAMLRKELTIKRNFQKLRESPGVRYESVGRGFESLPSHQTMKIRTFSR